MSYAYESGQYAYITSVVNFTVDPVFGTVCSTIPNVSARTTFHLTPILISRFLLNLRQLGEPENETQSRFNSRFSVPGFRVPTLESIVGNMGADLYHGSAEEVDGEVEEADMGGGDAEVSMLDAIAQNCSGGLSMENVYERQEVPSQVP
ncbi:hypothetical protein PHLCEN_2v2465 [Hermanssonia centrifuga]|uniref:Uncharacterized protein n=1 Tax=Hermanssonia centrifuga TaxID=98765 RepID=A0A2R6RLV1_9APHY|nr:hypothetical protein PHLCEN_2v2465 [Hermanssonia centrifuga]